MSTKEDKNLAQKQAKEEKKLAKKEKKLEKKDKKQEWKKKHPVLRWIPWLATILIIAFASGFFYLGGYKFETADVNEFAKYAQQVEDLEIPADVNIVALGEATHGNAEFQQLKLDVFKLLVEKYDVRAFALEADYAACLKVNDYIHGGEGTSMDAAKATGFRIYETQQMADLMEYMRDFNAKTKKGDDINIYGIDMQSMEEKLPTDCSDEEAEHYEALTAQHDELMKLYKDNKMWGDDGYNAVRDTFMTNNVSWVLAQEIAAGREMIFLAGHNGHIAKYDKTTDMGSQLAAQYGDMYYTIGTDFYKTRCTLRSGASARYSTHTFFSHDPLAAAAKANSCDVCLLNFATIPDDSSLRKDIDDYGKMGSLGERFSILNRLLPNTYQLFQCPGKLYDSLIIVTDATPTVLVD